MEEIKTKLIEALLETITYDDMTEKQEQLVVEYETEKLKPKVDELKKKLSKKELEETIHEWWSDYQIADGTENNLIAYIQY
ncbi:MAG: hypothetical protein BHW64_01755 [Candidatus Melainabacteria bacterium LEY3_CP_29_8]|nr:MAG: hypothetical protein BHW64_01755 [Candidatus Melainabacteria bacterium LEY3_CP_29_8]